MSVRAVRQMSRPQPTLEGAGVKLQRAFGFGNTDDHDPFLLFDDFRNDRGAPSTTPGRISPRAGRSMTWSWTTSAIARCRTTPISSSPMASSSSSAGPMRALGSAR